MRIDKERFFADIGYEPHAGQLAVHRSDARFRVVACGVRWGKTTCAAMEGIAAAMMPGERSIGWVVAPTYDLADRVFREIEVIVLERLRHRLVQKKEAERRIFLRNLSGGISEIRAKSADNPVSLLGEGLNWLVVDEAARLKPLIWQNHLSQRLIDKKGWALLISTPKGKGYLHEMFRRGQGLERDADWASWNMPSWTNPLLDASLIEAERSRLPQRVFAQEYGAQFVEGSGSVFRNVRECATGSWKDVHRRQLQRRPRPRQDRRFHRARGGQRSVRSGLRRSLSPPRLGDAGRAHPRCAASIQRRGSVGRLDRQRRADLRDAVRRGHRSVAVHIHAEVEDRAHREPELDA
ncbi:MAG: hypothetical protein IPK60_20895 [Sandaracinaceae bacterium]|nr:hypothetical protein [Sandaracinaceae bacterium]